MMKFSLYFFLLLIFLFSCSVEETLQASKTHQFQTLNDTSAQDLLSSTWVCSGASTNGSKSSSTTTILEVVHRYGPCARGGGEDSKQGLLITSSRLHAEILAQDQLRAQAVQSARLDISSGKYLGSGDYVVTIGLGTSKGKRTPPFHLTLMLDTGSDLTWTQCTPCFHHMCYKQTETMFWFLHSDTYSVIPCKDNICDDDLGKDLRGNWICNSRYIECPYSVLYGDGSYSKGYYSSDTLTLTPYDVVKKFRFGCGHENYNKNGFGQAAGILGLGRGPTSFVSQTKTQVFSYCLPDLTSKGFLSIQRDISGRRRDPNNDIVFTPFVAAHPSLPSKYYYIEITSISIGSYQVPISPPVSKTAVIDSGGVITRLPPKAYRELSGLFKWHMEVGGHVKAPAFHDLHTCYYITENDKVPTISFTFGGDVTIDLERVGTIYYVADTGMGTMGCLAFAGNKRTSDMVIFGNTQQLGFEVVYDVHDNQLGFRKNKDCS